MLRDWRRRDSTPFALLLQWEHEDPALTEAVRQAEADMRPIV